MILEEIIGCFVSLSTSLIVQTPPISRKNLRREYRLISEVPGRDEVCDGQIHREYEEESPDEVPYYEEEIPLLVQVRDGQPNRNLSQSFLRSCKANIGLLQAVVFILGVLTFGLVYVDLSTTNACKEWMYRNRTVPTTVRNLQMFGLIAALVPLYLWFPVCILMLWGMKEAKKNYLTGLCVCQLVALSVCCVYTVFESDEIIAAKTIYRLVLSTSSASFQNSPTNKKIENMMTNIFLNIFLANFPFR